MLQELLCNNIQGVNTSNDSYLRALSAEWRELFKQSANQTVLVGVSLCCSLWHAHRKLTISNRQAPSIKSVVKKPHCFTSSWAFYPLCHDDMAARLYTWEAKNGEKGIKKKWAKLKIIVWVRVSGSVNLKFWFYKSWKGVFCPSPSLGR